MFKVNKKNTKMTPGVVLVSLFLTLNIYTLCSSVSIVNFEQVNAVLVRFFLPIYFTISCTLFLRWKAKVLIIGLHLPLDLIKSFKLFLTFSGVWKIHLLALRVSYPIQSQCSPHIGTMYLICMTNQLMRVLYDGKPGCKCLNWTAVHFLTC